MKKPRSLYALSSLGLIAVLGFVLTGCPVQSSTKEITALSIESPNRMGHIIESESLIVVELPYGSGRTSLTPIITYTGVGISPESGVAQDFTSPVEYTVTAEDGSTVTYEVWVLFAGSFWWPREIVTERNLSVVYGNGIFIALANDNISVATSPDGITWTKRALPVPVSTITYGGGLFVAVGSGSYAATSPDGITWSARTLPSDAYWDTVVYGNGVFVAASYEGFGNSPSATSPDGINWTAQPHIYCWGGKATYGSGVFVAIRSSDAVITSADGVTWYQYSLPSDSQWSAITYGNGIFVTVAAGTAAATSPDGMTWTAQTLPAAAYWNSISYGDGVFVAVAEKVNSDPTTLAIRSPDGINWVERTLLIPEYWKSVAFGNDIFVAVSSGPDLGVAATSP